MMVFCTPPLRRGWAAAFALSAFALFALLLLALFGVAFAFAFAFAFEFVFALAFAFAFEFAFALAWAFALALALVLELSFAWLGLVSAVLGLEFEFLAPPPPPPVEDLFLGILESWAVCLVRDHSTQTQKLVVKTQETEAAVNRKRLGSASGIGHARPKKPKRNATTESYGLWSKSVVRQQDSVSSLQW